MGRWWVNGTGDGRATIGTVLKYREDHERVEQHGFADIVRHAVARGGAGS